MNADGSYTASVTSIEQMDDACHGHAGRDRLLGHGFVCRLLRVGADRGVTWKIANKTFVHTGGEMPTA